MIIPVESIRSDSEVLRLTFTPPEPTVIEALTQLPRGASQERNIGLISARTLRAMGLRLAKTPCSADLPP